MKLITPRPQDVDGVLALNQNALPEVSELTTESLARLAKQADYFKCAVGDDDEAIAFLLAMREGKDYASLNYQWFSQRYDSFLYIDRVVVAPSHQGQGIGQQLYNDLESTARRLSLPCLTCEVNLQPPNPISLAFHTRFGFQAVGQQATEGGKKQVQLLHKPL